ncbi:MAG TPA: YkgJ family cysteine cluster protein [Casimicrobiaceae bacterium]
MNDTRVQAPGHLQAAFDRERRDARRRKAVDARDAHPHTIAMYGRLAELQRETIADERVDVQCARGCSYCCHLRVEVRPHDAFVLAAHLRTRFDSERRARAIARIEANLARIAPLSPEAHVRAGIPCALLEDGGCSAYEARPATCRKYYSISVDVCRHAFDAPNEPLIGDIENERVRLAGNAVALGYAKGLEDAGFDAALYELHYALYKALTDPKAERRYRAGKRAFV